MNQTVKPISTLTILSIALLGMGVGTITPALNAIFVQFSDLPITTLLLVSTLPSLTVIPATLISGAVAGKQVSFRALAITGISLFVLGGVAPYFANDFMVILFERAIFGMGLGILAPLGNALVMGLYEGDRIATLTGMITLAGNIGGMILQFFGGYFASFGWNFSFLPHALGVISLILVIFFLPEPPKAPVQKVKEAMVKEKLPVKLFIIVIVYGVFTMGIYPMLMNMSTVIAERGIGTTATAGVVLALSTIGGILAGIVFGKIYKAIGRFVMPVGYLLATIGLIMVVLANDFAFLSAGVFLVGFAMSTLIPANMMLIAMTVKPTQMALGISLFMASMNLFGFFSTYWIGAIAMITGDAVTTPIAAGAAIAAILAVIFIVINPFKETVTAAQMTQES